MGLNATVTRHDEMVDLDAVLIRETTLAHLFEVVRVGDSQPSQVWIPRTLLRGDELEGWRIPLWLAERERLV